MDLLEVFLDPGLLLGCLLGVGAAFTLHWLFPAEDLSLVQGLLIIFFACAGMAFELFGTERSRRKRR